MNLQLRSRIFDEMKPGSRIVSHSFDMGDWDADLRDQVNYSRIYYWVVPAKIAGKWIITDGADKIEAELVQTHQKITGGTVKFTGGSASVMGLVTGLDVRIMTQIRGEPRLYAGRLSGNAITPIAGGTQGWTAARG